jgi:AcrR family transcriptional regulator
MTEDGSGGRPTKAQAAARTELLLDTARSLFCESGFAGATLDEVAARLRCSKHTIYRRYANKSLLLEAVVARDVERFRSTLTAAAIAEPHPLASLRAVARAYFDFSASPSYSALYSAIALETGTSNRLQAKFSFWSATSLQPLRRAIEAAAAEQGWEPRYAPGLAEILVDLLDGAANRSKWRDTNHRDLSAEFERRWALFCEVARLKILTSLRLEDGTR